MNLHDRKIAVGMSGGVDSSVAAWLLRQQGYDILGVTLKLTCDIFVGGHFLEESSCCSADDILVARENCQQMGVIHQVLNLSADFKEKIVDAFADEYLRGRTPNPCVRCNRYIKWEKLLNRLEEKGVHGLATGHYARITFNEVSNRYELLKARDLSKDQSYVLWMLTQEQLAKTILPLGDYTKKEIREIARSSGLHNADKPDSQDICFVVNNDYRGFLRDYRSEDTEKITPGDYVDIHGKVVGKHEGYYHYTVGQRRGLKLSMGEPVYVKAIDPVHNRVTVAPLKDLYGSGFIVSDLNWIAIESLKSEMEAVVKPRYRSKGIRVRISPLPDEKVFVNFIDEYDTATPGQSAVFYEGEKILGGGIIERSLSFPEELSR